MNVHLGTKNIWIFWINSNKLVNGRIFINSSIKTQINSKNSEYIWIYRLKLIYNCKHLTWLKKRKNEFLQTFKFQFKLKIIFDFEFYVKTRARLNSKFQFQNSHWLNLVPSYSPCLSPTSENLHPLAENKQRNNPSRI